MKKFIYLFLTLGIMFISLPNYNTKAAVEIRNKITVDYTSGESINETIIENDIVRREHVVCYEANDEEHKNSIISKNYKYITMHVDVTYIDKTGKKIATGYIESNYRYNVKYKEAKCLSTSHGSEIMNDEYEIIHFARTKNTMWTHGGAYAKIELKKGRILDKNKYILRCDYNGDLDLTRR